MHCSPEPTDSMAVVLQGSSGPSQSAGGWLRRGQQVVLVFEVEHQLTKMPSDTLLLFSGHGICQKAA